MIIVPPGDDDLPVAAQVPPRLVHLGEKLGLLRGQAHICCQFVGQRMFQDRAGGRRAKRFPKSHHHTSDTSGRRTVRPPLVAVVAHTQARWDGRQTMRAAHAPAMPKRRDIAVTPRSKQAALFPPPAP